MQSWLICGGRTFSDWTTFVNVLRAIKESRAPNDKLTIISGCANGADKLAEQWAEADGWGLQQFPADWEKFGRSAGPIRNKRMLEEGRPDMVIAFPGGKGTANMVSQARKAGVKVLTISAEGEVSL